MLEKVKTPWIKKIELIEAECLPVVVVVAAAAVRCLNDVEIWGNGGLFILECCDARPKEA